MEKDWGDVASPQKGEIGVFGDTPSADPRQSSACITRIAERG